MKKNKERKKNKRYPLLKVSNFTSHKDRKVHFLPVYFPSRMKMEFISTAKLATRNPALNKPIESRYQRKNVFSYSISTSAVRKE